MTIDGRRELLAGDPQVSCNQPVPLRAAGAAAAAQPGRLHASDRARTTCRTSTPGRAWRALPRGTVKKLRVVALDFRAALIGGNGNGGAGRRGVRRHAGRHRQRLLGPEDRAGRDADVHDDGSAFFTVPARTPVYFQALDARGYVVQTMRSWSTLQPGENASCVGCHESKNSAPLPDRLSLAQRRRAAAAGAVLRPAARFSFPKEIQPILDRHCIRCHDDRTKLPWLADARPGRAAEARQARTGAVVQPAGRGERRHRRPNAAGATPTWR